MHKPGSGVLVCVCVFLFEGARIGVGLERTYIQENPIWRGSPIVRQSHIFYLRLSLQQGSPRKSTEFADKFAISRGGELPCSVFVPYY